MKNFLYRSFLYLLRKILPILGEFLTWQNRQFSAPSPHFIKQIVLLRNSLPNSVWIETGTHYGLTTCILAKNSKFVYTIEPQEYLFSCAKKRLKKYKNVEIINSTSEISLPKILPQINGNVCFWLDGHYSAGITFKGFQDTPIVDELNTIALNFFHFEKVVILVDDVRCFNPKSVEYSTYPPLSFLVNWANDNNLTWYIEHDIFVAKNF